MASVSAFDAKTRFGELLKRVARGEEVVITRHDKPVARIVPEGVAGGAAGKRAAAALLELQHAIGRRSGTKPPPGSGPAAAGSPHGREPMVSWSSRRLSSWTGSPISSRRRGSTGIATTGCLRRITHPHNISTHADPVQHWCRPTSAYVRNRYILLYISYRDLFL